MMWKDLKKLNEAPESGTMMVYTRQDVLLEEYVSFEEIDELLDDKELLEIHLFDEEKEYRAISSRSPRFENGVIEYVTQIVKEDALHIYEEQIFLENEWKDKKLCVRNMVKYDECGMAYIDDYRLIIKKEG